MRETAFDTFGGWLDENGLSAEYAADLRQMELVAHFEAGGSYEWDTYLVYYHPGHERYYYTYGSGCSCDSIRDGINSLGDFFDAATKEDVVKSFRQTHKVSDWGYKQPQLDAMARDILNHQVPV